MSMLKQEFDDEISIKFTSSSKSTQTSYSKKRRFTISEDLSDNKDHKGKGVAQDDNHLIYQSPDYECHLDDFIDDVALHNEQDISCSKKDKYTLKDEESDEDLDKKNITSDDGVWINVNDLPYASPNVRASDSLFHDLSEEELEDSYIKSIPFVSGQDDLGNFIDDEDQDDFQSSDDYEPDADDESTDDDQCDWQHYA